MARMKGEVTILVEDAEVGSEAELATLLGSVIPAIAHRAFAEAGRSLEDRGVSVSGTTGPQGSSASVTVTNSGPGGSVSGTVTYGPGGPSAGVQGTWKF